MDQPSGRISAPDHLNRWIPVAITLASTIMLVARLWLVFHRLYDPDELQHLHAGFCIWEGQIPYRDFFEQHQPVLWYVSWPLFAHWGASLKVLFAGRALIWCIGLITAGLTWYLGNRCFGRLAGPIAIFLLVLHPPYQEKNVEWRPDNIAVPLVLLTILCLDRFLVGQRHWWAMLSGATLAAAFFCTQKVIYVGCGVVVACYFVCRRWHRFNQPEAALRRSSVPGRLNRPMNRPSFTSLFLAASCGAVAVSVCALGFFYWNGALLPYFQQTLMAPLEWQTREPMSRFVVNQMASGALLWGAGAAGWILVVGTFVTAEQRSPGAMLIAGGALTHAAGLLHVPAAFHQYYLPLTPLVALLAGYALGVVWQWQSPTQSRVLVIVAVIAGLAVTATALGLRYLVTLLSPIWIPIIGAGLVGAAVLCMFGLRRLGVLVALAASVTGTLHYHLVQFEWDHAQQTRRIEQLMRATDPSDAFFDGFTGYGALRPHAFKYFWINHHSWPMVPVDEKLGGVVRALEDPCTRVVLYDKENLARFLPGDARQVIQNLYEIDLRLSDFPALLIYVRRDRPLSNVEIESVTSSSGLDP